MNLLVVTQIYPEPYDDDDNKPTRTVEYFSKEWVKQGHKVLVIHCDSRFPKPFYYVPSFIKDYISNRYASQFPPIESTKKLKRQEFGIDIYSYPILKYYPGQGYSSKKLQKASKEIARYINEVGFKPDVVIGHFANPSLEIVVNLAKMFKAKSSIVFHLDCTEANISKYRIRENITQVGAIGARSLVEANEIAKRLNLNRIPFVCCSGVPNEEYVDVSTQCIKHDYCDREIEYLFVGSLFHRKHPETVVSAFSQLSSSTQNRHLTIIGVGTEDKNIQSLIKSKGIEHLVTLKGRIPRAGVIETMQNSHIFTLVSENEAFGMVYIEAMLQGCLVIASRGEGFDGIIVDGKNGFLCKAGDTQELFQIYKKIEAMTYEERNAIGCAAIETALHFSEREVAEKYLNDILENQR